MPLIEQSPLATVAPRLAAGEFPDAGVGDDRIDVGHLAPEVAGGDPERDGAIGQAVEVVTGSHSALEYVKYAETAMEFGLAASRGSDFHSPDESHTDLGTLPFLPGTLKPVWELLADRIQ